MEPICVLSSLDIEGWFRYSRRKSSEICFVGRRHIRVGKAIRYRVYGCGFSDVIYMTKRWFGSSRRPPGGWGIMRRYFVKYRMRMNSRQRRGSAGQGRIRIIIQGVRKCRGRRKSERWSNGFRN